MPAYTIERGKGKGSYSVYMTTENEAQAWAVYRGILVHSGGKKRLRRHGANVKTLHRVTTTRTTENVYTGS